MKKMTQKLLATSVVASALAMSAYAPLAAAEAELDASVAVANMYYWRGLDLGAGDPALIGDVNVSASGFYAGLWASSGDAALGTEWDFYAGYGFEVGGFSVDLNYTTYMYPSTPYVYDEESEEVSGGPLGFNDVADVAVTLGYAPSEAVSFSLMHRVGTSDLGDDDYTYSTLSASFGSFSVLYGVHADDSGTYDGLSHLDLTYSYNENLSFTLGKLVDDVDGAYNDELKFVVKLTLPLGN